MTKVSKCCKWEVLYGRCLVCQKETEEVCEICLGTGVVEVGEYDDVRDVPCECVKEYKRGQEEDRDRHEKP